MKLNMNSEINREELNLFLEQYREFIFPVLSIAISIMLILVFLLPQLTSFSAKNTQRNSEMTKLNELKSANNLITNIDTVKLESNLSLASVALPTTKDFESILSTMSSVGNDANVSITDYSFKEGDFSSSGNISKIPSLSFIMNMSGSPTQVIDFINKIHKAFPLCEVSVVAGNSSTSTLTVLFFYKPFSPSGSEDVANIKSMNSQESSALNKIDQWGNGATIRVENLAPTSSSSGEPNSPF